MVSNPDKFVALIAFGLGSWSTSVFIQSLDSPESPNYLFPILAAGLFWLAYWSLMPEVENSKEEISAPPLKRDPSLPGKNNLQSMYQDDARLAECINKAIDCASEERWQECEKLLSIAETNIEDWEPYDTSDSYYEMIWKSQISRTREFAAFKQ